MQHWYVAHVETGHEGSVERFFRQRLNYEAWCPEYMKPIELVRTGKRGRPKWRHEPAPLFPGYIVTRFDVGLRSWSDMHRAPGFIALLCGVGSIIPAPLPDGAVESLRDEADRNRGMVPMKCTAPVIYRKGEMLRVKGGAFQDNIAMYIANDEERNELLLEILILGAKREVRIPADTPAEVIGPAAA